jgi:hypothetical protein
MENEQAPEEVFKQTEKSFWNSVTPFSKYLAMALFVILPFVGGWIGYTFAPEKVVEIERVVEVEKEVLVEVPTQKPTNEFIFSTDVSEDIILFDELEVGQTYSGLKLSSIEEVPTRNPSYTNTAAKFSNKFTLTGSLVFFPDGQGFRAFIPDISSVKSFPLVRTDSEEIRLYEAASLPYVNSIFGCIGLTEANGSLVFNDIFSALPVYEAKIREDYVWKISSLVTITFDSFTAVRDSAGCYEAEAVNVELN